MKKDDYQLSLRELLKLILEQRAGTSVTHQEVEEKIVELFQRRKTCGTDGCKYRTKYIERMDEHRNSKHFRQSSSQLICF